MNDSALVRLAAVVLAASLVASACGGEGGEPAALRITADPGRSSPAPDDVAVIADPADPGHTPTYAPLDLGFLDASASSSELPSAVPEGLEVGFTDEGHPYRGNPDAAITVIEYSDYACPFCGRHTAQTSPALLEQYGVTGDVLFVFREFPLVSIHPTAPAAHTAALCAGEQGADLYWAMHDAVFEQQDDWTVLQDPTDFMADLAAGLGVEIGSYDECVASGRTIEIIADGVQDAEALGFQGTPSFEFTSADLEDTYTLIGAQPLEQFNAYLDALLAGEAPSDPAEVGESPEEAQLPYWANPDSGLAADPERPGRTIAGDFYKGDPSAPVVVIEVSDFECPFCRSHTLDVQPSVDEALVETGEIMWVYKHLPLAIHPHAPIAAAASECAGDQDLFWSMHDALFEQVERWATDHAEQELVAIGVDIGVDEGMFRECLAGRAALERVLSDQSDVRDVANSTPTFLIVRGGRGFRVEGSREAEQFVQLLRSQIEAGAGS